MKYTRHSVEDLIADEYFVQWVRSPDEDSEFFWRSFLENHEHRRKHVQQARAIVLMLTDDAPAFVDPSDQERSIIFSNILDQKSLKPDTNVQVRPGLYGRWNAVHWLGRVAAVLVVGLFLSLLYSQIGRHESRSVLVAHTEITKKTELGQKLSIQLQDGTEVTLNAGSKLTYSDRFEGTRDVFLEGEAFFNVTRNTLKPFVVHTRDMETTVLGTSFNVKENALKGSVEVAVVTGKVSVRAKKLPTDQTIQLQPTEKAVYRPSENLLASETFDTENELAWKDNVLYFDNASFEEVVDRLHRWYGVEILVQKPISDEKGYKGRYENKSLEAVLTGISFALGFDFEIDGDVVTIK